MQCRLGENRVVRCRDTSGQRILDGQDTCIDLAVCNLSRDIAILPAGDSVAARECALDRLLTEGAELTLECDQHHGSKSMGEVELLQESGVSWVVLEVPTSVMTPPAAWREEFATGHAGRAGRSSQGSKNRTRPRKAHCPRGDQRPSARATVSSL